MLTTKNSTKPRSNHRSAPTDPSAGYALEIAEAQCLAVEDMLDRPAAFFGISKHASDRLTRLMRGSLAYQPV